MSATYTDVKKKTLALIEEISPNNPLLTEDPDISTKYNYVANQIMFELARIKKLPRYVELTVREGDTIGFDAISGRFEGSTVYQLGTVGGVKHDLKADGTIIKALESGKLEINCYVYPKRITEENQGTYEYELSDDVIEIMPYGIAADLLKSDISTEYGTIYATRYESMLQRLDPRYNTTSIYIEGGVSF